MCVTFLSFLRKNVCLREEKKVKVEEEYTFVAYVVDSIMSYVFFVVPNIFVNVLSPTVGRLRDSREGLIF